eukprot:scaffold8377_cov139-Skeletonema_menzelii.AAC.1
MAAALTSEESRRLCRLYAAAQASCVSLEIFFFPKICKCYTTFHVDEEMMCNPLLLLLALLMDKK